MSEHYWFKANKSGYGWHPHSWEGWVVFFSYIGLLIHSFLQIDAISHSASDTLLNFLPRFLLFTAIITVITYLKGESITWGSKGRDQDDIP
ncbi:MAG: hypothetical protein H0W89_07925 [Candidatus Levybacteria bacterium]|nr:hypothetical protein [Candidatus Levybacteria bacterium]